MPSYVLIISGCILKATSDPILLRFFKGRYQVVQCPEFLSILGHCLEIKTTGNSSNPEVLSL